MILHAFGYILVSHTAFCYRGRVPWAHDCSRDHGMADGTSGIPGPVGLGAQSYHEAMGCWMCQNTRVTRVTRGIESQSHLITLIMFDA